MNVVLNSLWLIAQNNRKYHADSESEFLGNRTSAARLNLIESNNIKSEVNSEPFNMVKYFLFTDPLRQEEIDKFFEICQRHRDYYRGYPKAYHPLLFFREPEFAYQCPAEMSTVYLNYPSYHVKYKQPIVLPETTGCTSGLPRLPDRTLGARYGPTSKAYIR